MNNTLREPAFSPQKQSKQLQDTNMHGYDDQLVSAAPHAELMAPPTELDLLATAKLLWSGKWLIAGLAAIALLIGGYYGLVMSTPKFTASTRLAFLVRAQNVVDLDSVISGVSAEDASINTELEVIRSRRLIAQLVESLDLTQDPEFNETLREEPAFSSTKIKKNLIALITGADHSPKPQTPEGIRNKTIGAVKRAVSVLAKKDTYLFDIRVTSQDPTKSAVIANQLAEIYLNDQIAFKFEATEYAVGWLSGRVAELEDEINAKEDAIKNLRSQTGAVSLDGLNAAVTHTMDTRQRLQDATAALDLAEARLASGTALVATSDFAKIANHFDDDDLNSRAERAAEGDANAIAAFKARTNMLLARDLRDVQRLRSRKSTLDESLSELIAQNNQQNEVLAQLTKLEREASATRVLHETFLARLKETSVQIGLQNADSRVLSIATSGDQVEPRVFRILALSLVLGAMIGCALVLLRRLLNSGFQTADQLEAATGLRVLGQIPFMPIRKRSELVQYLVDKPTSAATEAIRNLRTSVLLTNDHSNSRVIMSTSATMGEGKTTLSIALAQNFAGLKNRVLLMECDIRSRTLSGYFDAHEKRDIVSVLSGETLLNDAVVHDEKMGVDVLASAESMSNAADLLSSRAFTDLIEEARQNYDIVIIDTPPVLLVPDARIIAKHVDTLLVSVAWDSTPKDQVLEMMRQLVAVGLRPDGLVLSKINTKRMRQYGYGSYYSIGSGYYSD